MTRPQRGALIVAILGSGIVFLDGSVVTVALPSIGRELPSSSLGVLEGQAYVYNGYLLALSSLLIIAGSLADHRGRRRVFVWGLTGFGVFSIVCGLAPNLELLVAFRVLQGMAGAFLIPASLALITAAFKGAEQSRAFGTWAGASAAAAILGPVAGGLLVDGISWRAVFLINAPLVVVTVAIALGWVTESRDEAARGRFDWLGAVVVTAAVGGVTFGLIRGQQRAWTDAAGWVALIIGVAAAALVPFTMRRPDALVPVELFHRRNFTVTNASTFVIYGALYTGLYLLTLFLQGVLGYDATAAGVAIAPALVLMAFFSAKFGGLSGRYGPRRFMVAGPALMAVGLAWLARIPSDSRPWKLASGGDLLLPPTGYWTDVWPGIILFGLGTMVMVAPLTAALMGSIPVANAGVGSAINNAVSRIGPQIAGALIFVAVTAVFYGSVEERLGNAPRDRFAPLNPPVAASPSEESAAADASTKSFHLAMLICAGLFVSGSIINLGIRDDQVIASTEIEPESLAGQVCVPLPREVAV